MPPSRPHGKGAFPKGNFTIKKGVLKRIIKLIFKRYKLLLFATGLCILISAVAGSIASPFLEQIYGAIADGVSGKTGIDAAWGKVLGFIAVLGGIYVLGIIANFVMGQIGAVLTQRFLADMRNDVFEKMEKLPVKYFDGKNHGDIMSIYTNDIDALRQLVSQSLPQICVTTITIVTLTCTMLYLSALIFSIVFLGVISILFVTKTIGSKSAKFFMAQQMAVGKTEGYIEEMMHGQKVIKVFCHEKQSIEGFDKVNDALCEVSYKANAFSNMLMPIIHNIGNILCVAVAVIGCVIAVNGGFN
ncbi:MAG: ABC transporter ATP-binding protein, partial [Clostridia bacterium]|nr:ABC transporter ATP-binding protein [Clostridia bacterium]